VRKDAGVVRKRERYRVEGRGYETPCWTWLLYKDALGYGRLSHQGRTARGAVAKLSYEIAEAIRARCAAGEPRGAVGRDYGIDRSYVGRIVRRERWA
jgi:hypothetical protein